MTGKIHRALASSVALALASVLAAPLSAAGCASTTEEPRPFGALETEACPDTIPAALAESVRCATIEVPQVHGDPSSPKIALRGVASAATVARVHEPVIYVAGGQGDSIAPFAAGGISRYCAAACSDSQVFPPNSGADCL